ncbi:MAG: AMP-binding protein [Geobacteraceae bacterium]|nr:AMP-binding protein [Geobacteraceae bacterium]
MLSKESVNISTPLTEMARLQPETAAIIFPEKNRTLTFSELDQWSSRLAAGFEQAGIGRGVRTALLVPPSPELFAITFALFKAGAVPVFIDPGIGAKNMKGCLADAAPTAFIGIPKAHLARRLLGWGKSTLKIMVTVNGGRIWGGVPLESLERSGAYTHPLTVSDETAAILFTSGSTGAPKGVVYSHGNFSAQIEALKDMYGIKPGEIDLPTFPLFALFAPALGMTALIPEMDFTRPGSVDAAKILVTAIKYRATTMFGSPALLNRVGRYGEENGINLPDMKRVISAGAPVPAATLERFAGLLPADAEIFTPYGATECLPVCSIGSREVLAETAELTGKGRGICVGRPVRGLSLAVIRITEEPLEIWADGLKLPIGEIGEIVVSAPQATKEYFSRIEATRLAKIPDDEGRFWHRMGDLGYLDELGRVWFCGRKSHRVITSSETLYTIPCEGVFNTHPEVFRTALVGIGAPGRKRPVLCVELEKGVSGSWHEQIRIELLEIGAEYPHTAGIKEVLFHPAFPVDIRHNAKIFREKLAVWAAGRVK